MKRVVVISDLHCGHRVGLTPPSYLRTDWKETELEPFYIMQKELWKFYKATLKKLQPINILIVNGDAIDGSGEKSGGSEQLCDVTSQTIMAMEAIDEAKAKKIVMLHGTPYHTGVKADFENMICHDVKGTISGREFLNINGTVMDCRHFISGSIVPWGQATSIKREKTLNDLWSIEEGQEQPRADILIRSHVHYHQFAGNHNYLAMTTPGLQGFGSKFGTKICSGIIHIGMVHFDIDEKGGYSWQSHLLKGEFLKAPIRNL